LGKYFDVATAKKDGVSEDDILDLMIADGFSDAEIDASFKGSAPSAEAPSLKPGIADALFPRSGERSREYAQGTAKGGILRDATTAASDLLSLPGRVVSALPALKPGGESFTESMGRTRAKEDTNPVLGFAENVARSPAMGAGGVAGSLARGAGMKLAGSAPALARNVVGGVAEAAPSIAAAQGERIAEGRGASAGEVATEAAVSAVLPIVGAGLRGAGRGLMTSAMKPTNASVRKAGFTPEQLVRNAEKHDVIGTFASFKKNADKVQEALDAADEGMDRVLTEASTKKGVKINTLEAFTDVLDEIDNPNPQFTPFAPGDFRTARNALEDVYEDIDRIGLSGELTADKARDLKSWLARQAFKKGPAIAEDSIKDKVKELLNLKLKDAIEKAVPEAAQYNQTMHELIPLKRILLEADKRAGNKNAILSLPNLIIGGAGYAASKPEYALPLIAGTAMMAKGRGAGLTLNAGKALNYGGAATRSATAVGSEAMRSLGVPFTRTKAQEQQ
jgi:hypothetical protein